MNKIESSSKMSGHILTYGYYLALRATGLTPSEVRDKWARMWLDPGMKLVGLISVIIGLVTYAIVTSLIPDNGLWITSPSKKTMREVPIYTALRIMRKRGWRLADVVPVRPNTRRSWWQRVKLLLGNRFAAWR